MSQLLTVMLIGRQAFLILMATEPKRPQSVSHDIPPAGKSLLLGKSAFLRNQCLLGSCLAGPRPKVHGEVGREGQILQQWTVSAPRGDFLSVVQQVLLDNAQAWYWAGESREMQERRLHLTREPRLRCVVKFNKEAKQASISSDPLVKPHLIGSKKKINK